MKKPMKFAAIASALLLTACGAEPTPSEQPPTHDASTEVSPSVSSGEPEKEESTDGAETTDVLIGYGGEALERESFVRNPNETNPNSKWVNCETDHGFIAVFDGNIYNSYDNPEKFDFENWECTESCEAASGGDLIIGVGDEVGGLTCYLAGSHYCMAPGILDEPHLFLSFACFDGEAEVTGYVYRCYGDEAYMDDGQLLFYPDGDSWRGLPVPCMTEYFTYQMSDGGFIYTPLRLSLGTVYDYPSLDLEREIPQGSTAHMRFVLKDIGLVYGDGDFSGFKISSAVIVSSEKISD